VRSKGARNARFHERRAELLARIKSRLTQRDAMRPTLRELAAAAGCSVSTLNHYFGKRNDIVLAVFAQSHERGQGQFQATRIPGPDFESSVRDAAALAWKALTQHGVAGVLAMGMVEGMRDDLLGPAFLETMFEPFVFALIERLDGHVVRGEMRRVDTRMAALSLASPLLLGALHQGELGGAQRYPLDGEAFLDHVVHGFVRAYRAG
jgi:AcrR family transcriptional regulator